MTVNSKYDYVEIGASCFKTMAVSFMDKPEIRGISVEPVSEYIEELQEAMGGKINENKLFLNVAIDEKNCSREFYYFDYYEFSKNRKSNLGLSGIGSFNKGNLEYEVKKQIGEEYYNLIKNRQIECLSIKKLVEEYNILDVDILKIDVEGYDGVLIRSLFETTPLRPKVIIYENLIINRKNPKKAKRLVGHIRDHNYHVFAYDKFNTICFKNEKSLHISCLGVSLTPVAQSAQILRQELKNRERASFNKTALIDRMSQKK
jgi:FkbM family methyltransferase